MLTSFWRSFTKHGFHPQDAPCVPREEVIDWTPEQAFANPEAFAADKHLHTKVHRNLFALPYIGDLENARVFILFGNPGFDIDDYHDEHLNSDYVELCKQNRAGQSKAFMCLDPKAINTGGGKYWRSRLKRLSDELSGREGITREQGYQLIAQKTVIFEACAYHSKHGPRNWIDNLPSSSEIRDYAQQVLVPRAQDGEILLFVWRRAKFWGISPTGPNIIVRPAKQAQMRNLLAAERAKILQAVCK